MIRVSTRQVEQEFKEWLHFVSIDARSAETKRAFANVLKYGMKAVEKRAKALAKPKRKLRKRKGFTPPPKRTGMLRKSFRVKSGVAKKGKGLPYAVVGPSKKVSAEMNVGGRTMLVKPSKYAHLVEFGFMAKHRKKTQKAPKRKLLGHTVETFKVSRPRRGSLQHTLKQFTKGANRLSFGKLFHLYAKILTLFGKGSTWVPGQYILERAYKESTGQIKSGIMDRMGAEVKKLFAKVAKRKAKKAALDAAKGPK
jgi:hypothetical protein